MKHGRMNEMEKGWIELLQEAKDMGISLDDIKQFLRNTEES